MDMASSECSPSPSSRPRRHDQYRSDRLSAWYTSTLIQRSLNRRKTTASAETLRRSGDCRARASGATTVATLGKDQRPRATSALLTMANRRRRFRVTITGGASVPILRRCSSSRCSRRRRRRRDVLTPRKVKQATASVLR